MDSREILLVEIKARQAALDLLAQPQPAIVANPEPENVTWGKSFVGRVEISA